MSAPTPKPLDHVETYRRALESICSSLELTLNKDVASDRPMAEVARKEMEDEFERFTLIHGEMKLGPESFAVRIKAWKGDITKALDFYERSLEKGMKAATEMGLESSFGQTKRELEQVKIAKQALNGVA